MTSFIFIFVVIPMKTTIVLVRLKKLNVTSFRHDIVDVIGRNWALFLKKNIKCDKNDVWQSYLVDPECFCCTVDIVR